MIANYKAKGKKPIWIEMEICGEFIDLFIFLEIKFCRISQILADTFGQKT